MAGKGGAQAKPVIIVRKRGGHGHGGHHGGAWKVAYADFVTAMMAFFLLMWLLGSTTDNQRKGIADFFADRIPLSPASGGGYGILDGAMEPFPGDSPFATAPHPALEAARQPTSEQKAEDAAADDAADRLAEAETARLKALEDDIQAELEVQAGFENLDGNLLFEMTPDGLRIQIFDSDGAAMFPRGSATPETRLDAIVATIAGLIRPLANGIVITGHTDGHPFAHGSDYGNWELSADRANAARRLLLAGGVAPERIHRVEGLAAREPLVPEDALDPRNRRIALTLLRTAPPEPGPSSKPNLNEHAVVSPDRSPATADRHKE
ncbi:flagellar motor protein MotB [Marinivivus vitaminiproducens]|uniref:flagellar motor protein MotB n=1 Tax=Marinivivus vitaminiproducens TaxID=3035935 RepID=UPI0027A092F6|nr:flagellar motor protein MotB [Geminicoccaceae bacterium SCSIO 64248]